MAGRLSFVCLEWHGLPGRRGRTFCCRPAKVMVVRSYTSKIPMITGNIMVGSRFWKGFKSQKGHLTTEPSTVTFSCLLAN